MNKFLVLFFFSVLACNQSKTFDDIDIQSHRGAGGLWLENSISGFVNVLEFGINTLEMDLVVTADSRILVSHEPFFSAEICLDSNGKEVGAASIRKNNIYRMTYEQIRTFDCGSKQIFQFPNQKKIPTRKPLLVDVIDTIESIIQTKELDTMRYNIEIKSSVKSDDIFHPDPATFSELVFELIEKKLEWKQVTIQSFDFRVLQYFHTHHPEVRLSLVIGNELTIEENIDSPGFTPNIYSCNFMLLSKRRISEITRRWNGSVIPWTVNNRDDMDQLLKWGVDGIITDYPNRVK